MTDKKTYLTAPASHNQRSTSTRTCPPPTYISFEQKTSVLKISLVALAALLFLSLVIAPATAADVNYMGQSSLSGTDTYHIATAAQLANLSIKVDEGNGAYGDGITFVLDSNIDLNLNSNDSNNVSTEWTGSNNWKPIGDHASNSAASFKGNFDGQGYTISNLNISSPAKDKQGLFGYLFGERKISNLSVRIKNITGRDEVGGLAGNAYKTSISNCSVTGGTIIGTGTNGYIGGLIGIAQGGSTTSIEYCYSAADVECGVSTYNGVGGLIGTLRNSGSTLKNSYATGNVTGKTNVGGLVGNAETSTIQKCVALNNNITSSTTAIGRVVGSITGTVTMDGNYAWDGMLINGQTASASGVNGISASSSQVWNNPAFYSNPAGLNWDLTNIWEINSANTDYLLPVLKTNPDTTGLNAVYLKQPFEGSGTEAEPYLIKSEGDLRKLAELVNAGNSAYYDKNYKVTENITLNGDWTPIGTSESISFKGTFNGNGKTISNLNISRSTLGAGLFGCTNYPAKINNLSLIVNNITGNKWVGSLIGGARSTQITNCSAVILGTVIDTNTGTDTNAGKVGGLVGTLYAVSGYPSNLIDCFVVGNVTGNYRVGGIAGQLTSVYSYIKNCYAVGNVAGSSNVGGIVGEMNGMDKLLNCVALNEKIIGTSYYGRIAGSNSGAGVDASNYGWDGMLINGQTASAGGVNGTSASSSQVWNNPTFYSDAGGLNWDLTNIWTVNTTNTDYLLPVLQANPDTTGLNAVYLKPITISDCTITVTNVTAYNGNQQSPSVEVQLNGEPLKDETDYIVTNNSQTSAGDYILNITGKGRVSGTVDKTWNISRAQLYTDNFTYMPPANLAYDGTEKAAQVEANGIYGNGTISITYHNASTGLEQSPTAAGTYKVNISVTEGTNYTAANLHGDAWEFTIQPINFNGNVTVSLSEDTYTYDGTAKIPTVRVQNSTTGNTLSADDYTLTGSITETAVGNYGITVTGINNYTGTITKQWNITAVKVNEPTTPTTSFAYTGSDITINVNRDTAKTTITNQTYVSVGEYLVDVGLKDTVNYTWEDGTTDNWTKQWNITAVKVSEPSAPTTSFAYTGSDITINVNRDTAKTTITNQTYVSVGEYLVDVGLKDKTNYTWEDGTTDNWTKQWNITAVIEDIPTASQTSFVYNGSAITLHAVYNSANVSAVNLTYTGAGEYLADFGLKDTANYTWMGGGTDNRTISWNITKAAVTALNYTYVPTVTSYNGSAQPVTVGKNTTDVGDITAVKYNGIASAPTAAGTYKINISVGVSQNYTNPTDLYLGEYTIEKRVFDTANISIIIEPNTYVFDAAAKTPTLNVTDNSGISVEFTKAGNFTKTSAGEYTINITGAGNYTANSIEEDWNITKAYPSNFTLTPASAVYTGANLTTVVTSKFGGMGDITNVTYNGEQNVSAVGEYIVHVDVSDGENYTAAFYVNAGNFTITQPVNPPTPSGGGGKGQDTGSGNYKEYDRSVTNGGTVSFGTSPTVTGVDLPKDVSGSVALIAESDTPAPKGKETVKVFEINIPNYPAGEKATIQFKLTVAEIEKAGYTPADVCIYHCDAKGVWTKLPTTYVIKNGIVYYEAVTTAFSPFAIVYEKGSAKADENIVIPTATAEPVVTVTSVTQTATAVPTATATASPMGLAGLALALGCLLLIRRK